MTRVIANVEPLVCAIGSSLVERTVHAVERRAVQADLRGGGRISCRSESGSPFGRRSRSALWKSATKRNSRARDPNAWGEPARPAGACAIRTSTGFFPRVRSYYATLLA